MCGLRQWLTSTLWPMRKVYLTVIGRNDIGIIANITQTLLAYRISIHDITQKIVENNFVLFMVLECQKDLNVANLQKHLEQSTRQFSLKYMLAEEELFNSMHRI